MNLKKSLVLIVLFTTTIITPRATTTDAQVTCKKQATIPYLKEIQATKLPGKAKQKILQSWAHLYATYLAKSATTKKNSKEWLALKQQAYIGNDFCKYTPLGQPTEQIQDLTICLDAPTTSQSANVTACHNNLQAAYDALTHNYLEDLQAYLSPTDFPQLPKDSNGYMHNYATYHLNRAVSRFAQTNKITTANFEPKIEFTGDIRDLGIIVNITNHTDTEFAIAQTGTKNTFIGTVSYGQNGVNLHTAALQNPQSKDNETHSTERFTFYPIEPSSGKPLGTPSFTIRIYKGSEIKNFLKTLPHPKDNDRDIFEMNGQPTIEQHIAKDNDWYMLIVHNPTPQGKTIPNIDQRIQAINLSTLTGPYLLTLQITETEHPIDQESKQLSTKRVLQPSFSAVQVIQPPAKLAHALPLIILPKYLSTNPIVQLYWLMIATTYIAATTDFTFFGADTFGSDFHYYQGLGYFDTQHEYRFIIDKYNLLPTGQHLADATWLIESALYATDLTVCQDIPQLYIYQNATGQMISNVNDGYHINFMVMFEPKSIQHPTQQIFTQLGFNRTYNLPYHQLYTLFFGLPTDAMRKNVFAQFNQPKKNLYTLSWTNKQNRFLGTKSIYLNYPITNMHINFLTKNKDWLGTTIPQDLLTTQVNQTQNFKITYSQTTNQHKLIATRVSALDRTRTIHTVEFSKFPLSDLYFDVYKVFKASPYTRCYMFQHGNLPKFLTNLTTQDWQNGILLVPTIKNNQHLSKQYPGELTVTFYKSDQKTILGSITTKGLFNNTSMKGIQEPVHAYNLGGKELLSQQNIFISTSILLKLQKN